MEYKDWKMEIKSLTEEGIFEGYASVFGVKDSYNDVVERGAFQRTINHSKGKVPIFYNHEQEIGLTLEMHEDQYGLWNKGQLFISDDPKQEVSEARKAYIIMKRKKELGVKQPQSFGYSAVKYVYDTDGARRLREIKLYEVSLATIPANELALVNEVKAVEDIKVWTVSEAKKWLSEHDFKTDEMDEIANYYAFRQEDPKKYEEFRMDKKPFGGKESDGIVDVYGIYEKDGKRTTEIQSIKFYHGKNEGKQVTLEDLNNLNIELKEGNILTAQNESKIEDVIKLLSDLLEQSRANRRTRESDSGKSYSDQELVNILKLNNDNLIKFIKNYNLRR